jgi:dihydropteroate synthase
MGVKMLFRFGAKEVDFSTRTYVMGILNITPDSFSDGGDYYDPERAVKRGMEMAAEGADFIDVGGESTRPRGNAYGAGAEPITAEEEMRRVVPVIRELSRRTDVPISIDTSKSVVAREALAAGASIVNDVSGFGVDGELPDVVATAGASVVLMHMRGTPQTMQQQTGYSDLFGEIKEILACAVARAHEAGIRQVIIDPGIGFAKGLKDNLRLLAGSREFRSLGCPVLVGPSRKTFIGEILNAPVGDRLEGTIGAAVAAALLGANIVRVHDVRAVRRALMVADAIHLAHE